MWKHHISICIIRELRTFKVCVCVCVCVCETLRILKHYFHIFLEQSGKHGGVQKAGVLVSILQSRTGQQEESDFKIKAVERGHCWHQRSNLSIQVWFTSRLSCVWEVHDMISTGYQPSWPTFMFLILFQVSARIWPWNGPRLLRLSVFSS
jgi:hypothetical protein